MTEENKYFDQEKIKSIKYTYEFGKENEIFSKWLINSLEKIIKCDAIKNCKKIIDLNPVDYPFVSLVGEYKILKYRITFCAYGCIPDGNKSSLCILDVSYEDK